MKDGGMRWFRFVVSALLLIFCAYQTYAILYKPINTATAVSYETYEGVEINGYFVREETVIDYQITGNERYVVTEGEKVAKNGTIAEVYASAEIAAAHKRAESLQEQIETLESINSVSDPASVDLETINNRIHRAYLDLMATTDKGQYTSLEGHLSNLLTLMNRKQILTGEVSGFDTLLSSLKSELATLQSGLAKPTDKVKSKSSGFFISQTDGLEGLLTPKLIETVDESIFEKIQKAEPKEGFGKIVSNYHWYILAKMENDSYLNFSEDTKVTLKTSITGAEKLQATVEKVQISKDKNSAVVVFSCHTMNGQIAMTRSAPMTIVTKEYEGIRVSNRAVRVVDGQTGVYIMQGSIVKFRPIEVLYATDTFTLCKRIDEEGGNNLRLYDEVIEKGKNLYDGKFIG